MKTSLSLKWFLWLASIVALFCILQVLALLSLELREVMAGTADMVEELSEIAVLASISIGVFVLLLGVFWFVSKRMIRPLGSIAETANRISSGILHERIEGEFVNDEVGALVAAINRAFDQYGTVLKKLERFTSNAAHQLRAPLTSIRNLGEVCLQRQRPPEEYRECIGQMLEASQELSRTVDKLLLIARLDSSSIHRSFEVIDVGRVTRDTVEQYQCIIDDKTIELVQTVADGLTVQGEGTLLHQALANILDNAVRLTPPGGRITVDAHSDAGAVVLTIGDTGPGIPAHFLPYVFERFSHIPQPEHRGSGLGLAIAAEIVSLHEGSIDALSGESGGTRIRLTLPAVSHQLPADRP
jgi:signal transduction histidine kinase